MDELTSRSVSVPNKGPIFTVSTSILTSIAGILVVYRLTWGWMKRKRLAADDIIIGASMVMQIVTTVVGDMAVHYSFGRHKADIFRSGGNPVLGLKFFWLFQIFYKAVLCLTKVSFLAFYLRIFPSRKFRMLCFITMTVVISGTFSFIIATVFQCIPIESNWNRHIHRTCVNNAIFRWCWAGYNTFMDIWVCLMPMPLLARLQLDTIRKVGVMIVFSLGLFVCVTSIIRMHAMQASTTTKDPTWGSFDALTWSAIEASTGIICACLPFLKHPIKQAFPRLFSSFTTSRKTRSRPTYGLSKLDSRSGTQVGGEVQPWRDTNEGRWTNVENDNRSTASTEPIAHDQIMMKTDISMRTEYVTFPTEQKVNTTI